MKLGNERDSRIFKISCCLFGILDISGISLGIS